MNKPKLTLRKNSIKFMTFGVKRKICKNENENRYTQSVLIRNGPIRSTSEIFGFFKK